jgi:hypothetical protein
MHKQSHKPFSGEGDRNGKKGGRDHARVTPLDGNDYEPRFRFPRTNFEWKANPSIFHPPFFLTGRIS